MTIINGHFNGTEIILNEPVPQGIKPDTPVRVLFQDSDAEFELDRNSGTVDAPAVRDQEFNELAITSEACAGHTLVREDFSDWEGKDAKD